MPTTHVIDWTTTANANKSPLTIVTEPDSIKVGDKIKVLLFSAYPHKLISPYNGLGSKAIVANDKPQNEVIELSGSLDIATKYPIKSISSLIAALPIVDENTRAIVVQAGASCSHLVAVINQQLKILNPQLKLHGSIRAVYDTFDAQVWTHNAFAQAGKALLFAENEQTAEIETVPLAIAERPSQTVSFKIEAYPLQGAFSVTNYAWFIVFPTDKNAILKVDYGTITRQGDVSHSVEKERISFSGTEATASFLIEKLVTFKGYFFDGKGKVIEPKFRVTDGKLVADKPCYGTGFLTYFAKGTVYSYAAESETKDIVTGAYRGKDTNIKIGTVYLFEKGKIGIATSYDIPNISNEREEPAEFFRIYSEYLVQDKKSFELPPNFPDDNTYPSNPSGELPDTSIESIVLERTHILGNFYSGGGFDTQRYSQPWLEPFSGDENQPDVVYKIKESIPEDADDFTKQLMTQTIERIKAEYGIV